MVKCNLKNCAHSSDPHEYDARSCKSMHDAESDLDSDNPADFPEELFNYTTQGIQLDQYRYADNVEVEDIPLPQTNRPDNTPLRSIPSDLTFPPPLPSLSDLRDEEAILTFYRKWADLSMAEILEKDPMIVIKNVEETSDLKKYHHIFASSRMLLYAIPQSTLSAVITNFIYEHSIGNFRHFGYIAQGVVYANMGSLKTESTNMMTQLSSHLEKVSHELHDTRNATDTILDVIEALRESSNKLSSASSKIEADMKLLEINKQKMHAVISPPSQIPAQNKKMKVRGYKCGNRFLAVSPDEGIDTDTTIKLNPDMDSQEIKLVQALAVISPAGLPFLADGPWKTLLQICPKDPSLSASDLADIVWEGYKNFNVTNHRAHIINMEITPLDIN